MTEEFLGGNKTATPKHISNQSISYLRFLAGVTSTDPFVNQT